MDSGNNGMVTNGSWEITDFNNLTVFTGNGNFGSSISESFYINNEVTDITNNADNENIIFPNPAKINQTINLNYMKQPESIRLFDSKGQLVKNDLVTFSFKNTLQIHQKGLYFVVSSNKNETLIKKIIFQ